MSPPAAAVVLSDLPPHRFDDLVSRLNPEARDRIASVVSTIKKARMTVASPGGVPAPPASQQATTSESSGLAMHTPAPSPKPAPAPVPALPRPSPATTAPASAAPSTSAVPTASAAATNGSSAPGPVSTPNALRLQHHVSPNMSSSQVPSQPGPAMSHQAQVLTVPSLSGSAAGPGAAQQPGPSGAFNSPTFANPSQSQFPGVESSHEYTNLAETIQRTNASIVRQVVRDQWHKCLVGSDYHCSFIANATFHQASTSTLRRAIQDFGQGMIKASKHQIVKHLTAEDLDDVASALLPKLSNKFLDQVLARRLETIGAQDLLNALARAERLGYDVHDIVERKPGTGGEHVIPSMQSAVQLPIPSQNGQAPPMLPRQTAGTQQRPAYVSGTPQSPSIVTPKAKLNVGPLGVPKTLAHCSYCHRPCSSIQALTYHLKKAKCQAKPGYETTGKEVCVHCGCRFTGIGGLVYHSKSSVCGTYSERVEQQMVALLGAPIPNRAVSIQTSTPAPPLGSTVSHKTPGQLAAAVSTPASTAKQAVATPASSSSDPYAKLTPEERVRFEAEMRQGEEHYGKLMKEALLLPDVQKEAELAKLKNRYNTRQSMTRKKYGIRLRERRSVAEIEAERTRLFGSPVADLNGHASKKARTNIEGQARVTMSASATSQMESPRKRVPIAEMGGLSGSSATAEMVDPTASLTPSQPRHLEHQQPPTGAAPQAPQGTPLTENQRTSSEPMQLDDASDDSSDTDSDDDDIPAKMPVA